MRIIGGEHRGRRIAAPKGRATRPMLDRVREAVFSSAAPWLAEARVLDLFAGSGSLGLEALSRGAASARFVEGNERTAGLLRDNLRELGVEERGRVTVGDALAPRTWAASTHGPFDLVFLDPPYPMITDPASRVRVLEAVGALLSKALAPDGLIVLHVPRYALDRRALPAAAEAAERVYGTNAVWYVTPPEDESEEGVETQPEAEAAGRPEACQEAALAPDSTSERSSDVTPTVGTTDASPRASADGDSSSALEEPSRTARRAHDDELAP